MDAATTPRAAGAAEAVQITGKRRRRLVFWRRPSARLDPEEDRLRGAVLAWRHQGGPACGDRGFGRVGVLRRHAAGGAGRLRRGGRCARVATAMGVAVRGGGWWRRQKCWDARKGRLASTVLVTGGAERRQPAFPGDRPRRRSGEAGANDPNDRALLRHPADAAQSACRYLGLNLPRTVRAPATRATKTPGASVQGKCACGRVCIDIDFPAFWAWHDHSKPTRLAHGAAYATYIGCWRTRMRISKGAGGITRYEDRATRTARSFCARCGARR